MRKALTIICFIGVSLPGFCQVTGTVLDEQTNTPLIGAHVYIINSLKGTVSANDGSFSLLPPNAYGELLITYVGYKDKKVVFKPASNHFTIKLAPLSNQLLEVSVKSTEDKKWKRLYKKFEVAFLGSTKNAEYCEITNPWVIDIRKGPNGELLASSTKPIEIINNVLGYKLTFHLNFFSLKSGRLHYQGDVYFNELSVDDNANRARWEKNRIETYLGSKRHFISTLSNMKTEVAGFEVFSASFDPGLGFTAQKRLNIASLVKAQTLPIPDYVKIIYTKSKPQQGYIANNRNQQSVAFNGPNADLVPKGNMSIASQSLENQVSYLYSRNSKLLFGDNGYIINNQYIIEYGYWSWLGVAEMLPDEYEIK